MFSSTSADHRYSHKNIRKLSITNSHNEITDDEDKLSTRFERVGSTSSRKYYIANSFIMLYAWFKAHSHDLK